MELWIKTQDSCHNAQKRGRPAMCLKLFWGFVEVCFIPIVLVYMFLILNQSTTQKLSKTVQANVLFEAIFWSCKFFSELVTLIVP